MISIKRMFEMPLEVARLRRELARLREENLVLKRQNDSMRTGMRRCLTCDYRLDSRRLRTTTRVSDKEY
ncbi:MAG: hypothetical protein AAGA91_06100 [Pseudomonadota bacterium]